MNAKKILELKDFTSTFYISLPPMPPHFKEGGGLYIRIIYVNKIMTIKEQTKLIILQNKQERLKIKDEKRKLILQQQEEEQMKQHEHIKNYLFSHYEITKNSKDKIQSSYINEKINSTSSSFINAEKVKNILMNIDGISHSKTRGCMFYRGLKEKENV